MFSDLKIYSETDDNQFDWKESCILYGAPERFLDLQLLVSMSSERRMMTNMPMLMIGVLRLARSPHVWDT